MNSNALEFIKKKWAIVGFLLSAIVLAAALFAINSLRHEILEIEVQDSMISDSVHYNVYLEQRYEMDLKAYRELKRYMIDDLAAYGASEGAEIDAASTYDYIGLSGFKKDIVAEVWGISGDFFSFHPYRLESGHYIREGDVIKNQILLNKSAAWNINGSKDIVGMNINIGDKIYEVAGVVDDSTSNKSIDEELAKAYILYSEFREHSEEGLKFYEIIMKEPVKNYLITKLNQRFDANQSEIVDMKDRFSLLNIVKSKFYIKNWVKKKDRIEYSPWENQIRSNLYVSSRLIEICIISFIANLVFLYMIINAIRTNKKRNIEKI